MAKLWHRIRDEEGKSKLVEDDLETLKITQPTLIYLSGFLTTDKQPGFIAGGIKSMEEVVAAHPDAPKNLQIKAWSHNSLAFAFSSVAYNIWPDKKTTKAAEKIAEKIILPLVAKDLARGHDKRLTGTPLPEEDASKNLRNLTFFSYSMGSVLAQQMFNATLKQMKEVGIPEVKARRLMKEVVLLSAGNVTRPRVEPDRFTTIYMGARNDQASRMPNRILQPLRNIFSYFSRHFGKQSREMSIRTLSEGNMTVTATLKKKDYELVEKPDGGVEKRKIKSLIPVFRTHHELPYYITRDDKVSEYSKIAQTALVNAVRRTKKLDPFDLLAPITRDDTPDNRAYREKIDRALQNGLHKGRV
ncbi:MAG: hypothetical protein OXT65_05060 [Alphaproteobacteria bacterium]|nr:hypothetical protein [Alphaproteobacteria bacterium]